MKIITETPRFLLREIENYDAEAFFELDTDPDVHRYLGNRPSRNFEEIQSTIDYIRQQYRENGVGRWAIIDKSDGNFVGWSGLKLIKEPINNKVDFHDIGYRLLKRYWGQGIAKETATAALHYGFDTMHLEEIHAFAHVHNNASNNILKKLGMELLSSFQYDGTDHYWYKISNPAR